MSKEHLIPFNRRTKEIHLAISAKGGRSKSQAKSFAAHIREIKKRGITDKVYDELSTLMDDSSIDMIEILIVLDQFKTVNMSSEQKIKLVGLMIKWMKLWYGDKEPQ